MSSYGKPLLDGKITYCTRCCMPSTSEGIAFDSLGMCRICRSAEDKMHINWKKRETQLQEILAHYKSLNNAWDCIIPISGGKDSTFQLHIITKVYKLRPLAVTFSHNWYTETGLYNLKNCLERFNVDHMMFTPSRLTVNKMARRSLEMIGDSCWHCHAGIGTFPIQIAVKFKVPLLIWGESLAELSGRDSYEKPATKFDIDTYRKASAKVSADQMVCDYLSKGELAGFSLPSYKEVEKLGLTGIYLGDYIFWDDERQMEFVRDTYGWKQDKVEGTYKCYKSVECRMAGVHDYTKFLKRGFGRGTDHASADVRAGLMTREEAFELAKRYDSQRPDALDYYLKITGYTEEEFNHILKRFRKDVLDQNGITEADFVAALESYRNQKTESAA